MFERFTAEARDVVVRAQAHARRLGHDWVGCEHLLLAVADSGALAGDLLRDHGARPEVLDDAVVAVIGTGPGPGNSDDKVALAALGIDLDEVARAVEASFGPGALSVAPPRRARRRWRRIRRRTATGPPGARPLTAKAKRSLELALREALRLKHDHIGVEHVALALLARDDTAAWKVLLHVGAVLGELRTAIEQAHGPTA